MDSRFRENDKVKKTKSLQDKTKMAADIAASGHCV